MAADKLDRRPVPKVNSNKGVFARALFIEGSISYIFLSVRDPINIRIDLIGKSFSAG